MVMSAAIMAGASLIGSGISAASNASSSRKAFERQKALQEQAARLNHEYSVKYNDYTLKNNPLLTRQGLEKGGYNPMLAVQNGTSGSNASSFTTAGQAPQHDMSASLSNANDFQRLINETKQAQSQIKMNEATAQNQNSQALNNLEENKWISPKHKAELANLEGDTLLKEAQVENLSKQIELGTLGLRLQRELGYAGFANAKDIANINASQVGLGGIRFNPKAWFGKK